MSAPAPPPASEDAPSFAELADEALWKSVTVVHEGEAMAVSEDVERARIALRRGAAPGQAIPSCRCFSDPKPPRVPRCNSVCEDAVEYVAAALSAAREQARAIIESEREARHRAESALREKDAAMGALFERLRIAGVDCSDLIS